MVTKYFIVFDRNTGAVLSKHPSFHDAVVAKGNTNNGVAPVQGEADVTAPSGGRPSRFRPVPPQEERDREYNQIRVRLGFEPNPD